MSAGKARLTKGECRHARTFLEQERPNVGSAFVVSSLFAVPSSLASSALSSFFAPAASSVTISTMTTSDSARFRSEGRYLREDRSEMDMARK